MYVYVYVYLYVCIYRHIYTYEYIYVHIRYICIIAKSIPTFFSPIHSWSLLGFLCLFGFGCLSLLVGLVLQLLGCWVSAMLMLPWESVIFIAKNWDLNDFDEKLGLKMGFDRGKLGLNQHKFWELRNHFPSQWSSKRLNFGLGRNWWALTNRRGLNQPKLGLEHWVWIKIIRIQLAKPVKKQEPVGF